MGFITTQDRIGTLSYAANTIVLQPSLLTIGGQQYRVPTLSLVLSGLAVNGFYMVYVVKSGISSFSLVATTNVNSIGPAGYNTWKLVGGFVASSSSEVGGFIKSLTGKPTTDAWTFTPTGFLTTNVTYTGKMKMEGELLQMIFQVNFTGVNTQGQVYINNPTGLILDTNKVLQFTNPRGMVRYNDANGLGVINGITQILSNSAFSVLAMQLTATPGDIFSDVINTNTGLPVVVAAGDFFNGDYAIPIIGWSDTPIAYL